jgi:hypothetical protein
VTGSLFNVSTSVNQTPPSTSTSSTATPGVVATAAVPRGVARLLALRNRRV